MTKAAMALIISAVLTWVMGIFFIPYMRKLKMGQTILEIGPSWHKSKEGTPTMGGLMFIVGTAAACLISGWDIKGEGLLLLWILLFSMLSGAIGFLDDYVKVAKKRNLGLTAKQKLALQIVMAAALVSAMRVLGLLDGTVSIPGTIIEITLPWAVYLFFSIIIICGYVNAVNFTDGVDGLLSCVTLPVMLFFVAASLKLGSVSGAVFSSAVAGGLIAFLMYNFNPAKIFMGDTGSLFLGGVVCALAFALNIPLILLLVGLVYAVELLSVVLQVSYFKLTHGKRIFKMAPIHHHFELCGWSEKKICYIFGGLTLTLCAAAWIIVL